MKRKVLFSITSALLCASLLSACTTTNAKTKFYGYWDYDAEIPGSSEETLVYSVAPDSNEPFTTLTGNYEVLYSNGTYTTVLKTEKLEERSVYRYETSFSIDVTYIYENETVTFTDTETTWVQFERSADAFLRPIASHKEFINRSPMNNTVATLEDCYKTFEYTVDTTYDSSVENGKAIVKTGDTETPNEFEISKKKYTYVDLEQLFFALRGINPTGSAVSTVLLCYAPFTSVVQEVKASFGTVTADTFNFSKDGEEAKNHEIAYYPVTVSVNAKNSGSSETIWVAKCENAQSNTYRNVILQREKTLAYGMGSLVYKLKSATFTK